MTFKARIDFGRSGRSLRPPMPAFCSSNLLVLFCLAAISFGFAPAVEPAAPLGHADVLQHMPADLATRFGSVPDANGLVGYNRDGFKAAAFQRGAMLRLAFAAARGDEKQADDCWRAVDAAFAHQTPEGNFGDPPTSVAFWLCEFTRSVLVIQESTLAGHFRDRIVALKAKIGKAAQWLVEQRTRLQREDHAAPNRLFFDGEACLFSGLLLGDDALQKIGHEFVDQGMKLYRPEDGVFLEHEGADSSYQAVNLLRLQEILLHFPNPQIAAAVAKGVQWEISRVGPDGAVNTEGNTRVHSGGEQFMGHEKKVNVTEITLALLYYHERTGDEAALDAIQRLHRSIAEKH
jgi:hypothetical protein